MWDFLDMAHDTRYSENLSKDSREAFDRVFHALAQLQVVHAKASLDLDNIESVFAVFEMAHLLGKPSSIDPVLLVQLGPSIRHLIVRTLEARIRFVRSKDEYLPPVCYQRLAEIVKGSVARYSHKPTVITFNYDVALDHAYHIGRMAASYSIGASQHTAYPLLKLHGSMNWLRCEDCNCIRPVAMAELFEGNGSPWHASGGYGYLHLLKRLTHARACDACKGSWDPIPVIVPPTWDKMHCYNDLQSVWRTAAEHLASAEDIIVIGYSLPQSDQFFRCMYALSTIGPTRLRRFWVFDPDKSGQVEERFKTMLGPMARSRFEYFRMSFADALSKLTEEFVPHAEYDVRVI